MKKNDIIEKHFYLREDICVLLQEKKRKDRRSESSIVEDILRKYLLPEKKESLEITDKIFCVSGNFGSTKINRIAITKGFRP